jgi:hypothetical protein
MTFEKATYVVASCDGCGPDWWEGTADTPPIFASKGTARRELAAEYEWRITQQVDGRLHMLCSTCAAKDDCVRYDHDWAPLVYRMDGYDEFFADTCRRCSVLRKIDEPPPGHPDSTTVELSDVEEEFLAAVDAELFPEEAT